MQVLLALAASPGEVVSRERLRRLVWADVFVGEDVLIRAISEIRRAFVDDPHSPHTIQTIPKVGYRLIAPVLQPLASSTDESAELIAFPEEHLDFSVSELDQATVSPIPPRPRSNKVKPRLRRLHLALIVVVVLVMVGALWTLARRPKRSPAETENYSIRPFTTDPGSELQPAFSPDGGAVAFVWRKEAERFGHIYVKLLNSEAAVRLTDGPGEELSPTWSPDGRYLAYVQHGDSGSSIAIIPAIGGSEHKVFTLPTNSVWEYGGLAWTPDGGSLIFPQRNSPEAASVLVELTLKGRTTRALTAPPPNWDGDWTPAISPDGGKLAFVRGAERSTRDVYVMTLPIGSPQRLTFDGRLIVGLTWAADSSAVVFSSNRGGSLSLWRVPASGGPPQRETVGASDAYGPSIAIRGNRMVYSHGSATWSTVAADLGARNTEVETQIMASSEQDASPHVSPTGDRIAFQSWRSGSQEIWTARMDGSNPVQLTSGGNSAGSPAWSRDAKQIAFDARLGSFAHIYVIDPTGGAAKAITSGEFNDIVPSWSADNRWLYFGSSRSGSWQIWKTASDGSGTPRQITTVGGVIALESSNAQWLYFTHYGEPGIWRCSTHGCSERKVFDGPPMAYQAYWTIAGTSIYSLSDEGGKFRLVRVDPDTRQVQTVHQMRYDPTPFAGLSLTPDGRRLVFAELARASSDLTLVEHFQ